ncbi:hypothetical protein BH18ACT15_BH18ACT15_14870 [soil metagenome]
MDAVRAHADAGRLVLGICNGFQVLCEAGLLPGALRKNAGLKFRCKWVDLEIANPDTALTRTARTGQSLRLPINHFEGNWYCAPEEIERLEAHGQIVLRYATNPNGSLADAAGIMNAEGNVLGLMPHPERACEAALGSTDGVLLFTSLLDAATEWAQSAVFPVGEHV